MRTDHSDPARYARSMGVFVFVIGVHVGAIYLFVISPHARHDLAAKEERQSTLIFLLEKHELSPTRPRDQKGILGHRIVKERPSPNTEGSIDEEPHSERAVDWNMEAEKAAKNTITKKLADEARNSFGSRPKLELAPKADTPMQMAIRSGSITAAN